MLKTTFSNDAKYTPVGFLDSENSNGDISPRDWRKDAESENTAFRKIVIVD